MNRDRHGPDVEAAQLDERGPNAAPVRLYVMAVLVASFVAFAVLTTVGAPLPPAGPTLLLGLLLALCVNRFAFFPSETAATAEAAVLLAAVVGFHQDAPFLGPLVLGLLVGPLDALHLRQRALLRMAYNSGDRALASLAAAATFDASRSTLAASPGAFVVAMVVAACAFAVVDSGLTMVLLRCAGEPGSEARRQVLATDVLTVPIALLGAAAGALAPAVGWLAACSILLPLAYVPEFVLARKRWCGRLVRNSALGFEVGGLVVGLALVLPTPDVPTVALLSVISVAAGLELAVDARAAVAPLLAMVVVAAIVATDGDAFFTAAFVAIIGTLTAWSSPASRGPRRVGPAIAVAALGGLVAAAVFTASRSPRPVGAIAAALAFEAIAIALSGRRVDVARSVWTGPVVVVAVALAYACQSASPGGLIVVATGAALALFATAWCASPPWNSGLTRRLTSASRHGGRVALLVALSVAATLAAAAAVVVSRAPTRSSLVWAALGIAELVTAVSLVAVRQWRFHPAGRRRDATVMILGATLLVALYPVGALRGELWSVAVVACVLTLVDFFGLPHAGRADRAARLSRQASDR